MSTSVYPVALPPPAYLDTRYCAARLDNGATTAIALHIDTDMVSGVPIFTLFTDDGYGNGSVIVSLPLAELRDAVKNFNAKL